VIWPSASSVAMFARMTISTKAKISWVRDQGLSFGPVQA
jgi:hypothetical protein